MISMFQTVIFSPNYGQMCYFWLSFDALRRAIARHESSVFWHILEKWWMFGTYWAWRWTIEKQIMLQRSFEKFLWMFWYFIPTVNPCHLWNLTENKLPTIVPIEWEEHNKCFTATFQAFWYSRIDFGLEFHFNVFAWKRAGYLLFTVLILH